jgi:histidine phosphotransferase ChpT
MLLIAGQVIPRGGQITVDPVGEGDALGFRITVTGTNAKIPAAIPPLLAAEGGIEGVDAHKIQPFYAGLLARDCGLTVGMATEGEAVVVATA